jgi:glycosyltransferase involved in cell wall biosynthesis
LLTHELASHTPLVSVVMPVCNHYLYIEQALDNILAQGLDDLELIVVDDGSETPVDSFVYAKVPNAILIRQANTGPSAARNQGIVRARGRFVAFLDADDIWETTALI